TIHCVVIGEHLSLVKNDPAVPARRYGFFRLFMRSCTASAIEEAEQPMMASTPSLSSHRSAMATPTSGLFWSSGVTSAIFLPLTAPPQSLTASRAAATAPGPQLSE